MMRGGWLALLVALPLVAGCLGDDEPAREVVPPDVGYDATEIRVSGVTVHEATIPGFDGAALPAVIYEPVTTDTVAGEPARFPVVVFVHPWGFPKETYENLPLADESGIPLPPTNVLQEFADAGIIAAAYTTRGWFDAEGTMTAAGPAEQADMEAVLDYLEEHFRTNGRFGFTGISYGGGHAFLAWKDIDRVVTAVPMDGWSDLYDSVFPGNVPKLEWGAALGVTGLAGTAVVRAGDEIPRWLADAAVRENMDDLESELDVRSIVNGTGVDKPLFTCQGLQETLFTDSHGAWETAEGFTRARYFTGGHNTLDRDCWTLARQWFQFFLAGVDTEVDSWPYIFTDDIDGETTSEFEGPPFVVWENLYLDGGEGEGALIAGPAPNITFTVDQMLVSNPIHEPSVVWDLLGMPFQEVPAELRQDPTGMLFRTGGFDETMVIVGAPRLTLNATDATAGGPWQVVATLYHEAEGNLRMLGRTAHAVVEDNDHDNGTVELEFPWTKADIGPEEGLVLKLASNDPTIFAPLLANYSVTFDGTSRLNVPFFVPPQDAT